MPHEIDAELIDKGLMTIEPSVGDCGICGQPVYPHNASNDDRCSDEYGEAHADCWTGELEARRMDNELLGNGRPHEFYN